MKRKKPAVQVCFEAAELSRLERGAFLVARMEGVDGVILSTEAARRAHYLLKAIVTLEGFMAPPPGSHLAGLIFGLAAALGVTR